MSRAINVTLEIGNSSLEVEIEYNAWPSEPMVRYLPDGSGYPGSPPGAELISAYVTGWNERCRNGSWFWNELDSIAVDYVEYHWKDNFEDCCLEAESELLNES